MPLGYFVAAEGRIGAALRVARGGHELVATGPAARLGTLLPHNTTTTTQSCDGRPLEVRLPFALALWLVLGCLLPSEDVLALLVYEYVVGAERLGSALDTLLGEIDDNGATALTPSVLRRKLLELGTSLRASNPVPFTVTAACLMVVGGASDDHDCTHLPTPLHCPALAPGWFGLVTYAMLLSPDGTFAVLAELECVWMQRFFASQRAVGGGFSVMETLLNNAMPPDEVTIIGGLAAAGKAVQYCKLVVTLLPTAPEMVCFHTSAAAAAIALSRAFARAISSNGALAVSVHDVLTVIPHYEPFAYAIGCEIGAPAALGLLLECVRAALRSPTAQLSLGNVAAGADVFKYLLGGASRSCTPSTSQRPSGSPS